MIKNSTNGKDIIPKARVARSLWSRCRGLMFTRQKDEGLIMVFPREIIASLHMLFVFYPIDILWLDEKQIVVDLRKKVPPFLPLIIPRKKAKYVIELPVGRIHESHTKINDRISF